MSSDKLPVMTSGQQDTRWERVWAHVDARRQELGWTWRHLYRETGVSDASRGQPLKRADKIAGLTRGLRWSRDSVELILAGGNPVSESTDPALNGDVAADVAEILMIVRELRANQTVLAEFAGSIGQVVDRISARVLPPDEVVELPDPAVE